MDSWMMAGLLTLFLISFFGQGPIPLPLTATVMWLGQFDFPALVVIVATVGSISGWLCLQHYVKRWVLKNPQAIQKIPASYQHFFLRRTGFWLFMFNALPFPLDFIRFLAILNGYSTKRLLVILIISRLIRNTSLVLVGATLAQHQLLLWTCMAGFMLLPLVLERLMGAKSDQSALKPAKSR